MIHEVKKTVVTLTVAECGEFHNLGEYHENITSVGEAAAIFKRIPPERMNGIPSIGINIHTKGTKHYEDTQMDIISGRTADLEVLDYVPDIRNNPKAMAVIAELVGSFPDIKVRGSLEKWQKPEKEKQTGRPSVREKLAEKKAVVEQRDETGKEIREKGEEKKLEASQELAL